MIGEAIDDEFNDLCSRLLRDPTLRDSWKNIIVEELEPVTPDKAVLNDLIQIFARFTPEDKNKAEKYWAMQLRNFAESALIALMTSVSYMFFL